MPTRYQAHIARLSDLRQRAGNATRNDADVKIKPDDGSATARGTVEPVVVEPEAAAVIASNEPTGSKPAAKRGRGRPRKST